MFCVVKKLLINRIINNGFLKCKTLAAFCWFACTDGRPELLCCSYDCCACLSWPRRGRRCECCWPSWLRPWVPWETWPSSSSLSCTSSPWSGCSCSPTPTPRINSIQMKDQGKQQNRACRLMIISRPQDAVTPGSSLSSFSRIGCLLCITGSVLYTNRASLFKVFCTKCM